MNTATIHLIKYEGRGDVASIPRHGYTTLEVASMATVRIPLTQGKVAIIDAEDADRVSAFKWCASFNSGVWYAVRAAKDDHGRRHTVLLHRFLLDAPSGVEVDHRDGDGLNCQRTNIRLATRSQNVMNRRLPDRNTSGILGVHWNKKAKRWYAQIRVGGKVTHLGSFSSKGEAAQVRAEVARRMHGEFVSRDEAV